MEFDSSMFLFQQEQLPIKKSLWLAAMEAEQDFQLQEDAVFGHLFGILEVGCLFDMFNLLRPNASRSFDTFESFVSCASIPFHT